MNKKLRPNLNGVEILDSWYEDLDALEEEYKKLRNHINKVKRERKKQPPLILPGLGHSMYVINRYQLHKNEDGSIYLIAESRRKATEEEVMAWLENQDKLKEEKERGDK